MLSSCVNADARTHAETTHDNYSIQDEDLTDGRYFQISSSLQDAVDRGHLQEFPGITSPFVYLGSPMSIFGMHEEDMRLLSVNVLLSGPPKIWVFVAPTHVQTHFPTRATLSHWKSWQKEKQRSQ